MLLSSAIVRLTFKSTPISNLPGKHGILRLTDLIERAPSDILVQFAFNTDRPAILPNNAVRHCV